MVDGTEGITIFYCYSQKDKALCELLEKHLTPLKFSGRVIIWYDRKIVPGTNWKQEIDKHLYTSDIILLLVSPDFMSSQYYVSTEMKQALERHQQGDVYIIPIILRPVIWQNTPLGQLKALPSQGKPIITWRYRDEALLDVVEGIRDVLDEIEKKRLRHVHRQGVDGERETQGSTAILQVPTQQRVVPPQPTDEQYIQQRESVVQRVYELLTDHVTAVTLTGIGGIGKSTLAALVLKYSEDQRLAGKGPFSGEPLWIRVESATTMLTLAEIFFEALGKPLSDLKTKSPRDVARTLLEALNALDRPRLVVLDQFENLLDWQTGQVLPDRPGVEEWIDELNNQLNTSRILLTSRSIPRGSHEGPQMYLQTYIVEGMNAAEGVALLRKQGVTAQQASDDEAFRTVEEVKGHGLALTLIASILRRNRSLRVFDLFTSSLYGPLWVGNIAENLLDYIYREQLDPLQRRLLQAFSIYREPVLLEAAMIFLTRLSHRQLLSALDALLAQHLLQAVGEGRYQLHSVISAYGRHHLYKRGEKARRQVYRKAAHYYLDYAADTCPPPGRRKQTSDVRPFIEALWHLCQAEQWREAYLLLEQEQLFLVLRSIGDNVILLELYQMLLPLKKWCQEPLQVGNVHERLGILHFVLGQPEKARDLFELALTSYRQAGEYSKQGSILAHLGLNYDNMGDKKQARIYFEQAVQAYDEIDEHEEIDNYSGKGDALAQLAWICNYEGDHKQALEYIEQALLIFQRGQDRTRMAIAFDRLGWIYKSQKKYTEAQESFKQALLLYNESKSRGRGAWELGNLASIYDELNQKEWARIYLEEALRIFKNIKDHRGEAWVLTDLGKIYTDLDRKGQADTCLQAALRLFEKVGDRNGEGTTLHNLGYFYQSRGQDMEALKHYEHAWSIREEIHDLLGEGQTLLNMGLLFLQRGHYDGSLASFLLARDYFEKVHSTDRDGVEQWMNTLQQKIGASAFLELKEHVASQTFEIVWRRLYEAKQEGDV